MSKVLTPLVRFDIINASTSLPRHGPISNIDILREFPRLQNTAEGLLVKFAATITQEFGFSQRYWAHLPWESLETSREYHAESLSSEALEKLLNAEQKKNIDAFVLGSTTNKRYAGSQACAVLGQHQIEAAAWDIKAGCSTSLASLQLAYSLMSLGYHDIVVSCAETLSKIIDKENELTLLGLADGAAAIYLQSNPQGAFSTEKIYFSSKGQYVDAFTSPGLLPPSEYELHKYGYVLKGDEELLKTLAYSQYTAMLKEILVETDLSEIKWIIPHQVSRKLINQVLREHHLDHANVIWHAHEIGNIGGASILYSLAKAVQNGTFDKNGKILMMSVGGGLTYATHIINYHQKGL